MAITLRSANLEVPAAPASAPGLAPGARVRILGLQSAAGLKLNGLEGELQSFSRETGRWDVILDSGEGKAIKPCNLEVRPGTVLVATHLTAACRFGSDVP